MVSKDLMFKMIEVKDELALCLKDMMLDFLNKSHEDSEYREKILKALPSQVPSRPDETVTNSKKYELATTAGYASLKDELEKTKDCLEIIRYLIHRPYFKIVFMCRYMEDGTKDRAEMRADGTWQFVYALITIRNEIAHLDNIPFESSTHLYTIALNIGKVLEDNHILALADELWGLIIKESTSRNINE